MPDKINTTYFFYFLKKHYYSRKRLRKFSNLNLNYVSEVCDDIRKVKEREK